MTAGSGFWTSKDYLPYQIHNFTVDMKVYAIKSEKFYQVDPEVSPGIQNTISDGFINGNDIEEIKIPSHAIKSIDLPTVEVNFEDVSGQLSDGQAEARDPDFQQITITFYAVDTPHGNIINLLPRIFHTYYLTFANVDGEPQPAANIPFRTAMDVNAPDPNTAYCVSSYINVELFRGRNAGNVVFTENQNGRTFREVDKNQRSSDDRRNVVYKSIAPVSYDLGELTYTENGLLECKMVFRYNVPFNAEKLKQASAGTGLVDNTGASDTIAPSQ
jgi:hypothetical protein